MNTTCSGKGGPSFSFILKKLGNFNASKAVLGVTRLRGFGGLVYTLEHEDAITIFNEVETLKQDWTLDDLTANLAQFEEQRKGM